MDRALKAARASGSLNLSNRGLREVPDEVYRSLDAIGEGEKWWEAVELQKLILAHNDIESLREDLKNLSSLSVLNVSHNKLVHLPDAIGELPMLKSLDLSYNSIANIPDVIGSATSLVKLDCSNNKLKELPNSLGRCLDLSELKASNNCITSLPEDLAHCSKLIKVDVEGNKLTMLSENMIASWVILTELNASRNLLTGLPENIGKLSHLIRLDFRQNRISSIPASIMGCCSLAEFYMGSYLHSLLQKTFKYLEVSGVCRLSFIRDLFIFDIHLVVMASSFRNNVLSSLPAEIGTLSLLGTLDLHSNQLTEYPVEACKLRLQALDLSNNSLSGLPPEIGMMTTLRRLVLTGNPLRTLRSSLVSGPTPTLLKFLRSRLSTDEDSKAATTEKEKVVTMAARLSITSKELSLEGMGLSAVPAQVWESSEILKVDLSKNSIQELPPELTSCVSLQALILSRNKIQEWPSVILKSLPNLSCLKLDYNPLRQIPTDGFQAVSKLQILDLSGNAASLPENPVFSGLPQLQELYLRRMQLGEVPSDILNLQQLQILDLSQNSLQLIPEGFKNLTSLIELNLSDNSITALPLDLGLLEPSLQALRLDGNPLRSIRRPILDKGTKAVLKYLKDKIPEH